MGGDFFTGAVLSAALTKLVLRYDESSDDHTRANALRAEVNFDFFRCHHLMQMNSIQVMLIMTSIIRVGQSKFVTVPIDEDSNERILSCIQTLSELRDRSEANDIFLRDTRAAYGKMLSAQEVRCV